MKAQVIKKHLDTFDKIYLCFLCQLHTITQIKLGCTELWVATPAASDTQVASLKFAQKFLQPNVFFSLQYFPIDW